MARHAALLHFRRTGAERLGPVPQWALAASAAAPPPGLVLLGQVLLEPFRPLLRAVDEAVQRLMMQAGLRMLQAPVTSDLLRRPAGIQSVAQRTPLRTALRFMHR